MPMRDTKQEIAMVYMRLADSRDPDKITVKDLVTACSISRQAFYYYFRDILEVPEWIIDEHFKEALQDALEAETPMGAVLAFTDIFYKNGRFIRRLENSERYAFMQKSIVDHATDFLQKLMEDKLPDLPVSTADKKTWVSYHACGLTGYTIQSLQRGKKEEETAQTILRLLKSGIPK